MRAVASQALEEVPSAPTFGLLQERPSPWRYFGTILSYVGQILILFVLARLPFSLFAPVLQPVDVAESVSLVTPELVQPPSEAPKIPVASKVKVRQPEQKLPVIKLPRQEAKSSLPNVPAPAVKTNNVLRPELLPGPKIPRTVVSTNFGGSSAPVTDHKPARQVQTGGFGDPNGVPINPNSTGNGPVIAKLGSFDLPEGPGVGNGTAGIKGTRGTVASAGFGNGIAVQGQGGAGGNSGQGRVHATAFPTFEAAAPDEPKPKAQTPGVGKDTAVSLLSKPTPQYTSEARQKKIEGDVELDVEFTATGRVHVLRVVQGLGFGLDEAAVAAAEQIKFAPARRDGQPVDSHGRLRIVFRLS
jgi:TonB family protein